MQSITKKYLIEIIERVVCKTIHIQRKAKGDSSFYEGKNNRPVTDEEIVGFIFSIPFFDEKLKDFLLGNIPEETIIISQMWEITFLKKCKSWAEGTEWLYGGRPVSVNLDVNKADRDFLSLPY